MGPRRLREEGQRKTTFGGPPRENVCPKSYDVRYMTLDERQDWIEHLLSDADVAAAQTPTPDSETVEGPPKGAGEAEEDFASHSG